MIVIIKTKMASQDSTSKIFRYKFTPEFQQKLVAFTKIHKFDDAAIFRENWEEWLLANNDSVLQEGRYLENLGYRGDIKSKMYKSVRYYYKDKSDKKVDPKKRRVYISLERDILDAIDSHVDQNSTSKPAAAYMNFVENSANKELLDQTRIMIMASGLDKDQAEKKIKKTYKNRFFIRTK